jgi:hypothetical protein
MRPVSFALLEFPASLLVEENEAGMILAQASKQASKPTY